MTTRQTAGRVPDQPCVDCLDQSLAGEHRRLAMSRQAAFWLLAAGPVVVVATGVSIGGNWGSRPGARPNLINDQEEELERRPNSSRHE